MASQILILDNGGDTIKANWSTEPIPLIVPNYAVKPKREKKLYVADQVTHVSELGGIYYKRTQDKGLITNFELTQHVWNRVINRTNAHSLTQTVDASNIALCLLECPLDPQGKEVVEFSLETMGFAALSRSMAQAHTHRLWCRQPTTDDVKEKPIGRGRSSSSSSSSSNASSSSAMTDTDDTSTPSSSTSSSSSTPQLATLPSLAYPCALVVDIGFSSTHIVPIIQDKVYHAGVKRVNVGGKLLTNYLKELLSYRQYNVLDETCLINYMKERLCYVSSNFTLALKYQKRGLATHQYVLPTGPGFGRMVPLYNVPASSASTTSASSSSSSSSTSTSTVYSPSTPLPQLTKLSKYAYLLSPSELHSNANMNNALLASNPSAAQVLALNGYSLPLIQSGLVNINAILAASASASGVQTSSRNPYPTPAKADEPSLNIGIERISVPELIFTPGDVGIEQAGLAEAIAASIAACPPRVQGPLWSSILVTGGTSNLSNITYRLLIELRKLGPTDIPINIINTRNTLTMQPYSPPASASGSSSSNMNSISNSVNSNSSNSSRTVSNSNINGGLISNWLGAAYWIGQYTGGFHSGNSGPSHLQRMNSLISEVNSGKYSIYQYYNYNIGSFNHLHGGLDSNVLGSINKYPRPDLPIDTTKKSGTGSGSGYSAFNQKGVDDFVNAHCITSQEWAEYGQSIFARKFFV